MQYKFIDFKWLIIGEKIKGTSNHGGAYDDDYISEMIVSQWSNLSFFGNTIIQDMIDYQFHNFTRHLMTAQLFLYLVNFMCPYLITLVTDDPSIVIGVIKICIIPQIILLCIEVA